MFLNCTAMMICKISWLLFVLWQARQKKKMMFGEQHLVRFGSMTKPAETDPLGDPQDAMDPQQVTYALLSTAVASCLREFRLTLHKIQSFSSTFPKTVFAGSSKNVSRLVL